MDTNKTIQHTLKNIDTPWPSPVEINLLQSLTENVQINKLSSEYLPSEDPNLVFEDTQETSELQNYLFSKFYLNLPNNKRKLYALMDSGSAISLFRENLLNQLLSPEEINRYKRPASVSITSFTHHPVPILYDIVIPCQFVRNTKNVFITFRVFKETQNYPILIGQDAMRLVKMDISYSTKSIEIFHPVYASLETIDTTSESAFTASAFISFKPRETKNIIFQPHPLCYIKKNTTVLIENSSIAQIHVFPTKYKCYSTNNIPFIACVSNLSNKEINGYLYTTLSLLEDYPFLDKSNKLEDFDNLPQTKIPALPYEHNNYDLQSFSILESLPKENINGQQKVSSYLLLTPHQSIHSHTKSFEPESKFDKSENSPALQNIKATLNDLKPPEDDRPNSPPLEIPLDFLKPSGYEIPDNLQPSVAELLNIESMDDENKENQPPPHPNHDTPEDLQCPEPCQEIPTLDQVNINVYLHPETEQNAVMQDLLNIDASNFLLAPMPSDSENINHQADVNQPLTYELHILEPAILKPENPENITQEEPSIIDLAEQIASMIYDTEEIIERRDQLKENEHKDYIQEFNALTQICSTPTSVHPRATKSDANMMVSFIGNL